MKKNKSLKLVCQLHTSQEDVDKIHLENGVEEVHQVTDEENASVPIILMKRFLDVFDQSFA